MKFLTLVFLLLFSFSALSQNADLEIEDKFVEDRQEELQVEDTPEPENFEEYEDQEEIQVEVSNDTFSEDSEESEGSIAEETEEEDQEFSKADAEKESFANSTADDSILSYSPKNLKNTSGKEIKMRHPLTSKGLTRITRDQKYLYDVKRSPQTHASTVMFSDFNPSNFTGVGLDNNTYSFQDFYTAQFMLVGDYEWQLFNNALGKFGAKVGSGLMYATGEAYFKDGTRSEDSLSLFMFPNFASVIWRMKFWDTQPFIPYVEAGAGYYLLIENKSDDNDFSFGAAPVAIGKGGIAFDIGNISRDTALTLDRDYGINSVSFNIEFNLVAGLGGDLDLSYETLSFGFGFEY